MQHIVKRQGHREPFDERKVYASAYAACLNVHMTEQQAEKIANKVCIDIKKWMKTKKQVASTAIFMQTVKSLRKHDKDAAFMYETHRDIS